MGAGRLQLSALALREAKIGVLAAVIAAFGAAISEVGAVIIVGGNFEGRDQTLASALLAQFNYYGNVPAMIAIGIVLLAAILAADRDCSRSCSSAAAASSCASGPA